MVLLEVEVVIGYNMMRGGGGGGCSIGVMGSGVNGGGSCRVSGCCVLMR